MTGSSLPLAAESVTRTTFEWGRIHSNADWILPIAACVLIVLFVCYLYRRDSVELHPLVGWLLTALRMATFFGLLMLFLQPHWRSEREVVRNSRVLLLADTSLSMGLTDGESPTAAPVSRSRQLIAGFAETDFLSRLRKVHDVVVVPFSEDLKADRAVSLSKDAGNRTLPSPTSGSPSPTSGSPSPTSGRGAGNLLPSPFGRGAGGEGGSDESATHSSAGTSSPHPNPLPKGEGTAVGDSLLKGEGTAPWAKLLAPSGTETRLGQALRQLIQTERGSPISGVVVFSDGGQNAGISPDAATELAREAKIPVFTVGLGSHRQPANVAVCDLAVPARAYPGDHYTVTGYVQAQGMAGKVVTVQLLARPATEGAQHGTGNVVETRQVTLGGDGEMLPVKFELTPDAPGRRILCFRVQPPLGDQNLADNLREADIEIVSRKNHVLLLAGGPTREYQFLRSQLYRDHATKLDVLLQSGTSGMSQEANKILDDFPAIREEMYDYDCVVAFDPNWQSFSPAQVELLEKWVGEQGGGLIVLAGSVNAGKGISGWTQDAAMAPIRNLYPVEFPSRLAMMENNVYASKEPWPWEFTREGLEADYLWLGDTATAGRQAWAGFPGVYSYCPVRGPKPGATVLARFSDPRTALGGQQPVYLASQFYGSGSVFYLGSGEMWRLRAVDETYFEQFYTKLIRHVSQGRLLRGSSRGVLLVGQDRYVLGNLVEVRAQLTNARLDPLALSSVNLQIFQPDGAAQTVAMQADPTRAGAYQGQFPALQEGTYRLELPVPESDNERLARRIQVKAPDLERENPRRNDALLSAIASGTGGKYYIGLQNAIDTNNPDSLVRQLKDRTSTAILTAAPNPQWEETWLRWIMVALCSLLCLEWLIRRLMKLA